MGRGEANDCWQSCHEFRRNEAQLELPLFLLQCSDAAHFLGHASVEFESVPQVLLSFYWFATQLSRSEEFEMASLASRQTWRVAHVFKNQESTLKHRDQSFTAWSHLLDNYKLAQVGTPT